jgi:hypothetical protein
LGYSFWYIASAHQIITLNLSIPLSFDELPEQYELQAPEKIAITLRAKRSDIYALDYESLAIHYRLGKILPGKHGILITKRDLFLPASITLVNYKPSNLTVTIIEKQGISDAT